MTLDFQLRPARQTDQRAIKAMVRRAQLNPLQLNWKRFTVAVDGKNHILGCIQRKPHGDGMDELASLVVARAWRGHGIARTLVTSIQQQAHSDLWLTCRRSLAPFYERFGFHDIDDPSEMGTYFRRIWRLARIFSFVTCRDMGLTIMHWQSPGTSREGHFGKGGNKV